MLDLTLNQIIKNDNHWHCAVFDFNIINAGNILIDFDSFQNISIQPFDSFNLRVYARSGKVVASGQNPPDFNFCALNFKYSYWRCILCKKISNVSQAKCFCESYSTCWVPISAEIDNLIFNNDCNFYYHFDTEPFSNLAL
jgi:hypothetical protein